MYLLPNDVTVDFIRHDFILHFQGHEFLKFEYLENGKSWRKNAEV